MNNQHSQTLLKSIIKKSLAIFAIVVSIVFCCILLSFPNNFYIEKNSTAGLEGNINISLYQNDNYTDANIFCPGSADTSKLFLSWSGNYRLISIDGTMYKSGTAPIAEAGKSCTYNISRFGIIIGKVRFNTYRGSKSVRAMFITIDTSRNNPSIEDVNSSEDKSVESKAELRYKGTTTYMTICGRGNSSWTLDKKPYKIKLFSNKECTDSNKLSLIDGQESQTNKYCLLSNYLDNSLMRNFICYKMAEQLGIGLPCEYTDVWINGEYQGNYLLTCTSDYYTPDEGYILELDNYLDEEAPSFNLKNLKYSGTRNRITIKEIGDNANPSECTIAKIRKYMDGVWDSIDSHDGYNHASGKFFSDYIDLESWAKLYLILEFNKDYDADSGSKYMYRTGTSEDDLLYAGPFWDADGSCGRTTINPDIGIDEQSSAAAWYLSQINMDKQDNWFRWLFTHSEFRQTLLNEYYENKDVFDNATVLCEKTAQSISASAQMNFVVWDISDSEETRYDVAFWEKATTLEPSTAYEQKIVSTETWHDYVQNLNTYIKIRAKFISENISYKFDPYKTIY